MKRFSKLQFKHRNRVLHLVDSIMEIEGSYLIGTQIKSQVKNLKRVIKQISDESLYAKFEELYGSHIVNLYGYLMALKFLLGSQETTDRDSERLKQDDFARIDRFIYFINEHCIVMED